MKKIKFKCWIEEDGEKIYGPGPNELIKHIQNEGSLSKAASKMNMSYKKAWDLIQNLNKHSEEAWVILKKGGQHGGGAEITEHALKAIQEFEELQQSLNDLVKKQQARLKVLK